MKNLSLGTEKNPLKDSTFPLLYNSVIPTPFSILFCLLGSCPDGYKCDKQVWEVWWLKYHLDNLLYTLYAADQGAFAVDHRAAGKLIRF